MVNLFVTFVEFASAGFFCNRRDTILSLTPDCGLDLDRGNLALKRDTSSHHALSFYEVSLHLLH